MACPPRRTAARKSAAQPSATGASICASEPPCFAAPHAPPPHRARSLLEYLEDIIGTNQYVERISEASKRLEELNEQRTSQVQRLKVTEKEKDGLSGSKAEAEEFIAKERELLRQRGVQYQLHVALVRARNRNRETRTTPLARPRMAASSQLSASPRVHLRRHSAPEAPSPAWRAPAPASQAQANVTKLREQKEELEAKLAHERCGTRNTDVAVPPSSAAAAGHATAGWRSAPDLPPLSFYFLFPRKKQKDFEESVSTQQASFAAEQKLYSELCKELERVEAEFKARRESRAPLPVRAACPWLSRAALPR